jgi:phosphoenolpyruvate synthase/pyruvate phosphate dikinase
MNPKLVKKFSELTVSDISNIGGKGASLWKMYNNKFPVPDGFIILSNTFDRFLKENKLNAIIETKLKNLEIKKVHTIQETSKLIQELIISKKIPKDIEEEILKAYDLLNYKYTAIRSSAIDEDSNLASWAGQLDSFLNTTKPNLIKNIKKCWASLFSTRAIFYRLKKGNKKKNISMAVVVQNMINSEKSGIAFSVHPITEDINQLIIEAGYGLGEAIVSGAITPDSYIVNKKELRIIKTNINDQKKGLYRGKNKGQEWKPINKLNKTQILNVNEIKELSKLVIKIEKYYGFPCDIEWTYEKGKFYITQSRPITTLKKEKRKISNKDIDTKHSSQKDIKKINLGDYNDYQKLFEWREGGLPFIISDISMTYYKYVEGYLITYNNNVWTAFITKKGMKKTLQEGLEIYSNYDKFNELKKNFEKYCNQSKKLFETTSNKTLTKEKVKQILDSMCKLLHFYSKTEYFYTDKAFKHSKKDSGTKNILEQIGEYRLKGREYLNKVFLGPESYLDLMLTILSSKFSISIKDLKFYSIKELISLFDNITVKDLILKKRRISYIMIADKGNIKKLEGNKAKQELNKFFKLNNTRTQILFGNIANPGKIQGIVKIADYGYNNFKKSKDFIKDMKKGEILVAETTAPEIILACNKASAILTNQGGIMSHAAIVSRELRIPCIVGLNNATTILKNGDEVIVDANNGTVEIINKNKFEIENLSNSQRLFKWLSTLPFLITSIFTTGYKNFNILILSDKKLWSSYIHLNNFKNTLDEGLNFYSSKTKYKNYVNNFNKYKIESETYFKKYLTKDKINKKETKEFLDLITKVFAYSTKVEFYYTDKAFFEQKNNKTIEENFKNFESFKLNMRKQLNKIFFEKNPYITRFVKKLSKQFNISSSDLWNYNKKEILNLFEGKYLDKEKIEKRKIAYIIKVENKKEKFICGKNAEKIIEKVNNKNKNNSKIIKGQIANKGFKRGFAKVIKFGINDFSKLNDMIESMKKDDILVAETTAPEIIIACQKASAIITNQGGMMSHAAIVSREMNIPCIVGTDIATEIIQDGQEIEVDANKGTVKILNNDSIQRSNYVSLMRFTNVPLLLDFYYLEPKIKYNVLAINNNSERTVYYPKKEFEKSLNDGKKFYATENLEKFEENIRNSANNWLFITKQLAKKKEYDYEEIISFCKALKNFYSFYDLTDFYMTDKAINIIKKEMPHFGKLKKDMRIVINQILLGDKGLYNIIFQKLGKQFNINQSTLLYMTPDELKELFKSGKKISTDNRIKQYIIRVKGKKLMLDKNINKFSEFKEEKNILEVKGVTASKGKIIGKAVIFPNDFKDLNKLNKAIKKMKKGDILFAETTSPEIMPACSKAGAIITNQGGLMSHAAIISRELKIPCIVGTNIGTKVFNDEEIVEVDANNGIVKKKSL